jgi:site-specific recombinase XerD
MKNSYVIEFLNYIESESNIDIKDPYSFRLIKPSFINRYSEHIRYRKIEKKDKDGSYNVIKVENGESIRAAKIYAIKNFFSFLCIDRYIDEDPSLKIPVPKVKNEIQVVALDEDEIETLKRNIINGIGSSKAKKRQLPWKNRDLAIVMIGLVTGLRVESIVEINISDINFQSSSINVIEKGRKARTCYIGKNTTNILLTWMEDREKFLSGQECDALFLSSTKNNGKYVRITTSGVRKLVKKYTDNIDKHITPHKLRSTCATTTYRNTGDIYLTASVIGHKNIQNTRRYAMVAEKERQTAACKLDNIFG